MKDKIRTTFVPYPFAFILFLFLCSMRPLIGEKIMTSKIGFIGLGAMGKPMAANIARAGFELTVYDLREERCKELAALGAAVVASPREIAAKSEIIEIAVVDDDQAERVVIAESGVIHGAR